MSIVSDDDSHRLIAENPRTADALLYNNRHSEDRQLPI